MPRVRSRGLDHRVYGHEDCSLYERVKAGYGRRARRQERENTVENAQLYTLPDRLPPILIAASGTRSAQLAGRIGDGLITVGVTAELVDRFMVAGGTKKPRYAELNVCWDAEEATARRLAHARWPIAGIQGALLSDLRLPSQFAQAATSVSEEDVAQSVVCGPDPARHIAAITRAAEVG
jgi:G6PDH family F420-dependent oxidoreductase